MAGSAQESRSGPYEIPHRVELPRQRNDRGSPFADAMEALDDNLRRLLTARSSLGSARPKAATEVGRQPWIAKFPAKEELATMRLAADCGLDVPNLGIEQAFGRDIYLIERFDRTPTNHGMLRRSFTSGLTLLGGHERDVGREIRSTGGC
jgi:serine/threonine-protein kinase HipA